MFITCVAALTILGSGGRADDLKLDSVEAWRSFKTAIGRFRSFTVTGYLQPMIQVDPYRLRFKDYVEYLRRAAEQNKDIPTGRATFKRSASGNCTLTIEGSDRLYVTGLDGAMFDIKSKSLSRDFKGGRSTEIKVDPLSYMLDVKPNEPLTEFPLRRIITTTRVVSPGPRWGESNSPPEVREDGLWAIWVAIDTGFNMRWWFDRRTHLPTEIVWTPIGDFEHECSLTWSNMKFDGLIRDDGQAAGTAGSNHGAQPVQ